MAEPRQEVVLRGEAGADPARLIDHAVIAQLKRVLTPEQMRDLVRSLVVDTAERLERMAGMRRGVFDIDQLFRDAHDLTSMAGNFGLTEFSDAARRLELVCRKNDEAGARRELPQVLSIGLASLEAIVATSRQSGALEVHYEKKP